MNAKNAIDELLRNSAGNQTSGREMLVRPKRSSLDPKAAAVLKEQWKSAGRDHALVVMMLTEEDGSNPHFVTGWNGKDTFVCLTESGLTYVDHRHLEKLKVQEQWNPETRLIELRAHQLTEDHEMHGADVKMLVDRIKKTLSKSSKSRRKGRLRNMEKFFSVAVVESNGAPKHTPFSGPLSGTEFEPLDVKDDRVPEEPKNPSTSKLPKGRTDESFGWDNLDGKGRPVRRGLRHPMMRNESNQTDPQLDDREQVQVDGESGGSAGGATPGGNKTDPDLDDREQIDVRHESVRSRTDPGMGGPPHQGGDPVGAPSYHHEDPTGGTPAFQAAARRNRATSMRPGGPTYKHTWVPGRGRGAPLPDATSSEKRAASKQERRAGNQAARKAGAEEMFRRSQPQSMTLAASTDPELDSRELVHLDAEGGSGAGGATPGGNKTDAQMRIRQLVRMDRESGGASVHKEQAQDSSTDPEDDDYTDYAGQKGKSKEFSSRPKISVRHEALSIKKGAKGLFGAGAPKRSPEGAEKPLLMLVLMSKGKKAPMAEGRNYTCTNCGTVTGDRMGTDAGHTPEGSCQSDACREQRHRSQNRPARPSTPPTSPFAPKSTFESRYGRSRLNLAEAKKTPPAFLANIEKMKARAKGRSGNKKQDCA